MSDIEQTEVKDVKPNDTETPQTPTGNVDDRNSWKRILHWILTVSLGLIAFYYCFSYQTLRFQLGQILGTFHVYDMAETDTQNMNAKDTADYIVYAYCMKKPLEPFDPTARALLNWGETKTMKKMVQRLEEKTGDSLGNNLEAWVEKYGNDTAKRGLYDAQGYRTIHKFRVDPFKE